MRVTVDLDLCGGHGVCELRAPEIFRVVEDPDGYAHAEVRVERPPRALHDQARTAARLCPNRAIAIDEDA